MGMNRIKWIMWIKKINWIKHRTGRRERLEILAGDECTTIPCSKSILLHDVFVAPLKCVRQTACNEIKPEMAGMPQRQHRPAAWR